MRRVILYIQQDKDVHKFLGGNMSANHLSNRKNWQMGARITGDTGENEFVKHLAENLPDHYTVQLKPPKLKIYPNGKGIILDAKVTNEKTNQSIFVEKKTGNNGGNAHERVYKMVTEGVVKKVRKIHPNTPRYPVFPVFSGDTFQRPSYQEKLEVDLDGVPYAIIEPDFANIKVVAEQIMDII
jgi:hypothetical protein